jgi:hypothetical protein
MKKQILGVLVTSLITTSAYCDTDDDTQPISITVPEVALLEITDTGFTNGKLELTLTAPTNAGDGFSTTTSSAQEIKLSSNVLKDTNQKRTVDVTLSGTLPKTWKLDITPSGITTAGEVTTESGMVSFTNDGISGGVGASNSLISGIDNELISSGASLTYTFGPETTGGMLAYTESAEEITVTYTLSDDS